MEILFLLFSKYLCSGMMIKSLLFYCYKLRLVFTEFKEALMQDRNVFPLKKPLNQKLIIFSNST